VDGAQPHDDELGNEYDGDGRGDDEDAGWRGSDGDDGEDGDGDRLMAADAHARSRAPRTHGGRPPWPRDDPGAVEDVDDEDEGEGPGYDPGAVVFDDGGDRAGDAAEDWEHGGSEARVRPTGWRDERGRAFSGAMDHGQLPGGGAMPEEEEEEEGDEGDEDGEARLRYPAVDGSSGGSGVLGWMQSRLRDLSGEQPGYLRSYAPAAAAADASAATARVPLSGAKRSRATAQHPAGGPQPASEPAPPPGSKRQRAVAAAAAAVS
jgi:hypothetical protein